MTNTTDTSTTTNAISDTATALKTVGNSLGSQLPVALGKLVVTAAVRDWRAASPLRPMLLLAVLGMHETGEWGQVDNEDRAANDTALLEGGRLLSAWDLDGERVWIITEGDRSATTLLFPADY